MPLTELQHDALCELVNIGAGKAAGALSRMTDSHVDLCVPEIILLNECELAAYADSRQPGQTEHVLLDFAGQLAGRAVLVFDRQSAGNLVALLTADMELAAEDPDMRADALREVGNVVLIWITGSIAAALGEKLEYQPLIHGRDINEALPPVCSPGAVALLIKAGFSLKGRMVDGDILILFSSPAFNALTKAIKGLVNRSLAD